MTAWISVTDELFRPSEEILFTNLDAFPKLRRGGLIENFRATARTNINFDSM